MKRLAVVISEGFEEMECVSTVDVLRRGGVEVEVLGLGDVNITGAHGITITCDEIFNCFGLSEFDGVVLVGGMKNAITLSETSDILSLLEDFNNNQKLIAGICATPSIVFSKTNILSGKGATCYPSSDLIANLENFIDSPVVVSGNVITSQSPATAIDFALAILNYFEIDVSSLISELKGKM